MSKYMELRTKLTEEQYLVEALRELGYTPEVCREGTPLVGYMGDERAERAQIVVRRQQLDSASNDIGFARDGTLDERAKEGRQVQCAPIIQTAFKLSQSREGLHHSLLCCADAHRCRIGPTLPTANGV